MEIPSESLIEFHSENISFELDKKPAIISWLSYAIENEQMELGEITYVFCSDDYLHKINLEHLDHDTLTDIITFDFNEENIVNGDLFISIDRIKDNAKQFDVSFDDELHRVMVHGVMHLCGFKDKTSEDQKVMSSKEDFYLNLRNF